MVEKEFGQRPEKPKRKTKQKGKKETHRNWSHKPGNQSADRSGIVGYRQQQAQRLRRQGLTGKKLEEALMKDLLHEKEQEKKDPGSSIRRFLGTDDHPHGQKD
jgi:hypothetical protein